MLEPGGVDQPKVTRRRDVLKRSAGAMSLAVAAGLQRLLDRAPQASAAQESFPKVQELSSEQKQRLPEVLELMNDSIGRLVNPDVHTPQTRSVPLAEYFSKGVTPQGFENFYSVGLAEFEANPLGDGLEAIRLGIVGGTLTGDVVESVVVRPTSGESTEPLLRLVSFRTDGVGFTDEAKDQKHSSPPLHLLNQKNVPEFLHRILKLPPQIEDSGAFQNAPDGQYSFGGLGRVNGIDHKFEVTGSENDRIHGTTISYAQGDLSFLSK